jgi:urease alpha subunit
MTEPSKKSSQNNPLHDLVDRMLVSREFHEDFGTVTTNITEAVLAVAQAINRLAASHELAQARFDQANQERRARMALMEDNPFDKTGHA